MMVEIKKATTPLPLTVAVFEKYGVDPNIITRDGLTIDGWNEMVLDAEGKRQIDPFSPDVNLTRFRYWKSAEMRAEVLAALDLDRNWKYDETNAEGR